jgi:hypothetical protein
VGSIHYQSFENVKAAIAKEIVLAYPVFLKPFEIYTDAPPMQLGAVITQDNKPIAFFSRKLSKTQQKYSVTEIGLLERSSKGMLWGQDIKVYTYHNNLTRDALGLTSRGSGGKNVIFSNGPNSTSECSKLLY